MVVVFFRQGKYFSTFPAIWINDLDFEYANNDFSGINQENLIQIGSTFINTKFDQRLQNLPMALEKLKKCLLEQIK